METKTGKAYTNFCLPLRKKIFIVTPLGESDVKSSQFQNLAQNGKKNKERHIH